MPPQMYFPNSSAFSPHRKEKPYQLYIFTDTRPYFLFHHVRTDHITSCQNKMKLWRGAAWTILFTLLLTPPPHTPWPVSGMNESKLREIMCQLRTPLVAREDRLSPLYVGLNVLMSTFYLIAVSLAVWQHVTVMEGRTLTLACPLINAHRSHVEWRNHEHNIMFFNREQGKDGRV